MPEKSYYVDACVYLNIWKKERRFWKGSQDFFLRKVSSTIYYSGYVLKEVEFNLGEEMRAMKSAIIERLLRFDKLTLTDMELNLAREIETAIHYEISFYDIIHIILAKKSASILVTRDRKLIKFAKVYGVEAKTPEEVL